MLTHKSMFWVPILAAGGPYFTKNGSLYIDIDISQKLGGPYWFKAQCAPIKCCRYYAHMRGKMDSAVNGTTNVERNHGSLIIT